MYPSYFSLLVEAFQLDQICEDLVHMTYCSMQDFSVFDVCFLFRGFSSVLPIILNPTSGFTDDVSVSSVNQFFHSNAWLGAVSALVGVIGGQLAGIIADRYVIVMFCSHMYMYKGCIFTIHSCTKHQYMLKCFIYVLTAIL